MSLGFYFDRSWLAHEQARRDEARYKRVSVYPKDRCTRERAAWDEAEDASLPPGTEPLLE